ncbi:hypothetical protein HYC85_004375 [Camellia sinensis]|uniref:Uncharacterized protein n=1 Tax=Camellia sinensis TaxID=4442 RepID=A0A7J7HWD3_CAMSI|nr:hypothetical protein HYC85_004375 [Camellia sinensis]
MKNRVTKSSPNGSSERPLAGRVLQSIHTLPSISLSSKLQNPIVLAPFSLHLLAQHLHHPSKHLGTDFQRLKALYLGPEVVEGRLYKGFVDLVIEIDLKVTLLKGLRQELIGIDEQRGAVQTLIEMLQSPDVQLRETSAFALGLELPIGLLGCTNLKQQLDGSIALYKLANKATTLSSIDAAPPSLTPQVYVLFIVSLFGPCVLLDLELFQAISRTSIWQIS